MVDAVQPGIRNGATAVLWDNAIDKKQIINASQHISDIHSTLSSMFKVLR